MRVRIFGVVFLLLAVAYGVAILSNPLNPFAAAVVPVVGLGVGVIVGRMYRISWDAEASAVIGNIDWIGGIVLVVYLVFAFSRERLVGQWIDDATDVTTLVLGLTAGVMLGRVLAMRRSILRVWNETR